MPFTITITTIAILYSLVNAKKYRRYLEDYQRSLWYDSGNYNKQTLAFINRFESISLTLIMAMFICFFIEC